MDVEKFEKNIGRKCKKRPINDKNIGKYKLKPFKSGFKVNTIAGVIKHPKLEGRMAYTFEEDESYVECRRCQVIKPKFKIKSKEEIIELTPIKPKGLWWREYASNFLFLIFVMSPVLALSLSFLLMGHEIIASTCYVLTICLIVLISVIMMGNTGPLLTDKHFGIHYYKKRNVVWDKWWTETNTHFRYLKHKEKYEI